MKITDIDFYPKFIFSSEDGQLCLSTTDIEILGNIKSAKSDESKRDYSIGDVIYYEDEKNLKFKVTDINIRRIIDNTDSLKVGFDSSDCVNTSGADKEALFVIHITIEKI